MSPIKQVGPYRLLRRLGVGGMGEVWEAWDARLERRVAAKHVRAEVAGDEHQRRRFRREARMAARLAHPAIVQVFDLVEQASGDWLVMEYIEGTTVADLVSKQGALPLGQVIALASDVADGLAEAHAQGMVHRDLKAENVVVTTGGRAKILDFGLARLFETSGDDRVTATGVVVGTFRAMSPEQAAGLAVDPRSDLFALGVLLYEMVTGESPFAGESRVETLKRVYSFQQPSARERNPAVPRALSALIDRLLEKDSARRPSDAAAVAAELRSFASDEAVQATAQAPMPLADSTLIEPIPMRVEQASDGFGRRRWMSLVLVAAFAAAVFFFGWRFWSAVPTLIVAVAPVELVGEAEEPMLLRAAVETSVLQTLVGLDRIIVLAGDQVSSGVGGALESMFDASAADEVISTRLDCTASSRQCTVTLRRYQAPDGRIVWTSSDPAPSDDLELATTAASALVRDAYADRSGSNDSGLGAEQAAIRTFLELRGAYEGRGETVDAARLIEGLEQLVSRSPRFLEPRLLLAKLISDRFFDTRDRVLIDQALSVLKQARALAPHDPRPVLELATVAITVERLEVAEGALSDLERMAPGDPRILQLRALLAERRGDSADALALMRRAVDRLPSRRQLLQLANLEIRLGKIVAAQTTLERLERRLPTDIEGLALRAQLELLSGDPERAALLYEQLVARAPRGDSHANLGVALMLVGRYEDAIMPFRDARNAVPANATVLLNLADAVLLAGRADEATELYRQVLELAEADAAAAGFWQNATTRAQALAQLGRHEEAVEAVIRAGRLAPDNPQVIFETALVYALVGDQASALVHARAALAAGVDQRWFRFPWFASLPADVFAPQESSSAIEPDQ